MYHIIDYRNLSFQASLESALGAFMDLKSMYDLYNIENKRLTEALNETSAKVSDLRRETVENADIVEYLFREKWETLNTLCNDYFYFDGSDSIKATMVSNIDKEIKKLKKPKSLKEIEDAVNKYMGNIMTLLREECGFLKNDDFIFLSLVFAGLSAKAICVLTDIKFKYFYLKRSRLLQRIEASNAVHKHLFIDKIR